MAAPKLALLLIVVAAVSAPATSAYIKCLTLSYVQCPCGKSGHEINVLAEDCLAIDPSIHSLTVKNCRPCDASVIDPCSNYTNCASCDLEARSCATCPAGKIGKFCNVPSVVHPKQMSRNEELKGYPELINVENADSYRQDACVANEYQINRRQVRSLYENEIYPIEVYVPPGESMGNNRYIRSASECFFPDHMDTAEIRCTIWPTYTKCNVTCIWGHTLPAGHTVTIKCRNRENQWKPMPFKECEPYVDCSLKLKSPGSVNCVYNRLNEPIECDIMCNEYDDIPEVPKMTYACTLQGTFKPALPFCVTKANSTTTVRPPAWRK